MITVYANFACLTRGITSEGQRIAKISYSAAGGHRTADCQCTGRGGLADVAGRPGSKSDRLLAEWRRVTDGSAADRLVGLRLESPGTGRGAGSGRRGGETLHRRWNGLSVGTGRRDSFAAEPDALPGARSGAMSGPAGMGSGGNARGVSALGAVPEGLAVSGTVHGGFAGGSERHSPDFPGGGWHGYAAAGPGK